MVILIIKSSVLLAIVLFAWFAARKPDTPFGRLSRRMFAAGNPMPEANEPEQEYFLRYSFWTLKWCVQLLIIWGAGIYLFYPKYDASTAFEAVFYFMLPLIGILAIFGFVLLWLRTMFCKLRSTEKIYNPAEKSFVAKPDSGFPNK